MKDVGWLLAGLVKGSVTVARAAKARESKLKLSEEVAYQRGLVFVACLNIFRCVCCTLHNIQSPTESLATRRDSFQSPPFFFYSRPASSALTAARLPPVCKCKDLSDPTHTSLDTAISTPGSEHCNFASSAINRSSNLTTITLIQV